MSTTAPARSALLLRRALSAAALALALAAAACLLACASQEPSDGNGLVRSYDDQETVTLSFFALSAVPGMWPDDIVSLDGSTIHVVEDHADYYAKGTTQESYRGFLASRLAENSVDAYIVPAEDVIDFDRHGYLMDLSGLDAASTLSVDALAQSTYDGKVFSIPLSYTGFGFIWNKDMLDAHGLSVPEDLGQFLHVCETLKAAGITPYVANNDFALTAPAMAVGFADLYASDDAEQLLADLSSGATPVSTYMEEGFAFVEMLADKGYLDVDRTLSTAPNNDVEPFLAQEGAFVCGLVGRPGLADAEFATAGTAMPVLDEGSVAVVGADRRMAINPSSEKREYAVEAIEALCAPDNLKRIAGIKGQLTPLADDESNAAGEAYASLVETVRSGNQIPNQDFRLHFNTWASIRDLCRELLAGSSAHDVALRYDDMQRAEVAQYDAQAPSAAE